MRLPGMAQDLVSQGWTSSYRGYAAYRRVAANEVTSTIPIVMVGTSMRKSRESCRSARPGGNITGLTLISVQLVASASSCSWKRFRRQSVSAF